LVTGAGGQVGHELQRVLAGRGWEAVAADHASLDLVSRDEVRALVHTVRPTVVFNAAAYTKVDDCETSAAQAFAVNALGVRHVAEACHETGAHLVHFSTDYVFDGTKTGPYVEWDSTNPLSVYGRSKLAGEVEAMAMGLGATVVRTSWVCGQVGHNIVRTLVAMAAALAEDPQRVLSFVVDQHGCPTMAGDLAETAIGLGIDRRPGLFHVTNQGPTTWHGFASEVVRLLGEDPARVRPVTTDELDPPRPAPRPANSVLEPAALRASGLPLPPPWIERLPALVTAIRES
jgi:dTDP-4-dehydrorhamnose reductase